MRDGPAVAVSSARHSVIPCAVVAGCRNFDDFVLPESNIVAVDVVVSCAACSTFGKEDGTGSVLAILLMTAVANENCERRPAWV